ncbi:MAG: DUF5666 domain-containing protein [Acidobacteriota bacterium]
MRAVRSVFTAWMAVLLMGGVAPAAAGDTGRGQDIHFRGPIFTISRDTTGNTVQLTIGVNNGQVDVMVTSWTEVIIGRGFTSDRAELSLGDFVEVSGFFTASGPIVAQRIHVETRDAIDLQGRIDAISGNLVQIAGLDFLIDPDSVIRASGNQTASALADLQLGQEAHVRAVADGAAWRVDELVFGARSVVSEPLRFEGVLLEVNGDYLSVDVGIRYLGQAIGTPVARDQKTVVEGELRTGRRVDVEGTFLPGTTMVVARHIVVDSNGNNNVFDDSASDGSPTECELAGTIHGLGPGQGGQLQFYIQETLIRLNSQTQIRLRADQAGTTSDLADGLEVEVAGTRLQDRTVQASRIQIRQEEGAGEGSSGDSGGDSGSDSGGSNGDGSSGGGSGDVGGSTPGGETGGGGDGSGADGGSGEHESTNLQIIGIISDLHRLEDDSVDRVTVDSVVAEITAQTEIEGGESEQLGSAALQIGQHVQIDAIERADGSVFARKIEIKD